MDERPTSPASTPQEDADRIRLKRLAKLQGNTSTSSAGPSTPTPAPVRAEVKPKPIPPPSARRPIEPPAPVPTPVKRKPAAPAVLNFPAWETETILQIFHITLDASVAEKSGYDIVWLKNLAKEFEEEQAERPIRLSADSADRLLITRLELNPAAMSDDLDYLPVLASLEPLSTFEYLVGCWKRCNSARSALLKRGYTSVDTQKANASIQTIKDLVVSYAGLSLQEPEMFPQPEGRDVADLGAAELVAPLLNLSALSTGPLSSSSSGASTTLGPTEIESFLNDLAHRFSVDEELPDIIGPVILKLLSHPTLFRREGLAGGDAGWRGVMSGLEALVSVKSIALVMVRMKEWNPSEVTAFLFDKLSLMGPLCRLNVFGTDWPDIATTYFPNADNMTQADLDSSFAGLRGTLKSLQSSLFKVFETLVRGSPETREAVLAYFARVVYLNRKRSGQYVQYETVSSDSFMLNLQTVILRFAEPFMDASYSKMDRIDPLYHARSNRIDLTDETRIKATSEEAAEWAEANKNEGGPPPNFVSDIFYLTTALMRYGMMKTVSSSNALWKDLDDYQRELNRVTGDNSWMGTPMQARVQTAIDAIKAEMNKIRAQQFAYQAQLLDPELVFRSTGFINFLSTWIIRQADPTKSHPSPCVSLPLPTEVPLSFRVLPEYIVESIVEYQLYIVRESQQSLTISGKSELIVFALTFLTSTWYIKNPFVKMHVNEALYTGCRANGPYRNGIFADALNSDKLALQHLIPAMINFYIEAESTGSHSQFWDKFNARHQIAAILKTVWHNPTHRLALKGEFTNNLDRFVRFINLMINDVTFLLEEALTCMEKIHDLEIEIASPEHAAKPEQERREREAQLRSQSGQATQYTLQARSTLDLFKEFTVETKAPFVLPEIVDRLAAMLTFNLEALAGPRTRNLKVKDADKLKFHPKLLLSDILQVFLNLSGEPAFVQAVAGEGRSYRKSLFESAARIADKWAIKSTSEIEQLLLFVVQVEIAKEAIEAEDDLGEVPEEFEDPLMATVMREPVRLPSSRAIVDMSTIKAHLLSDATDPFNRVPLTIDQVIPDLALKARIQAFLIERRKKAAGDEKPASEVVDMSVVEHPTERTEMDTAEGTKEDVEMT